MNFLADNKFSYKKYNETWLMKSEFKKLLSSSK